MSIVLFQELIQVICRIGSLEIKRGRWEEAARVICRIGSLETDMHDKDWSFQVICRIGSLETFVISGSCIPFSLSAV